MTEEWSAQAQGSPATGSGVSGQRPMAGGQRRHHDLTWAGPRSRFVGVAAGRGVDAADIGLPTWHARVCLDYLGSWIFTWPLSFPVACDVACDGVCPGSLRFPSPPPVPRYDVCQVAISTRSRWLASSAAAHGAKAPRDRRMK